MVCGLASARLEGIRDNHCLQEPFGTKGSVFLGDRPTEEVAAMGLGQVPTCNDMAGTGLGQRADCELEWNGDSAGNWSPVDTEILGLQWGPPDSSAPKGALTGRQ